MAEYFLRHSPLGPLGLGARALNDAGDAAKSDAGITMGERPFRKQAGLRGDVYDTAFTNAVKKALGIAPPADAHGTSGSASVSDGVRILWMSPDEWLCVADANADLNVHAALSDALRSQHAAAWDVSGSRTVIAVSGPRARDLLSKGCTMDLHPSAFPVGHVIAGHVALAHCEIDYCADDETGNPIFELYVHRSYAEYLWSWLEDAALEYGLKVVPDA